MAAAEDPEIGDLHAVWPSLLLFFLTFSHHNRRSTLSISSPRSPHRTSLFHYALVVKGARLIHMIVAASNKCSFGTQNFRSVLFLLLFIPHPLLEELISLLFTCPHGNNSAVFIARLAVIPRLVTFCCPSRLLCLEFIG